MMWAYLIYFRAVPKNLKNDFGRALYGLLGEILGDSDALKSDNKEEREAVLSKYSTELGVMNGEIQKPEKLPHVQVSVDEVSASFQDIVTRLGFSLVCWQSNYVHYIRIKLYDEIVLLSTCILVFSVLLY